MYGDPTVIRGLARTLRDLADDLRGEADRLVARAEGTLWTGLGADAMRHRARERGTALRRTAERHEDAADALDRHAAEVERLQDLIAAIERRVRTLLSHARDRLAGLAGAAAAAAGGLDALVPDPLDRLLDHFESPSPGHRAWLHVDLPPGLQLPGAA